MVAILLGIFTYGDWIPKGSVSFRKVVTSPVIHAIIITLILLGTGTAMPKPLGDAFSILGGMAVPLMLLTLGHSLATLKTGQLGLGALLAAIHVTMGLAIGNGLSALFGFSGTEHGVLILMSIMPPSVATYLFVELYAEKEASQVASLILISTLMMIVVLPIVMTFII